MLQQSFVIEYVLGNKQCPICQRREAKDTWNAVVQVRQKVPHKRTFLWIEQLILKHNAHADTVNITELKDGLDGVSKDTRALREQVDGIAAQLQLVVGALNAMHVSLGVKTGGGGGPGADQAFSAPRSASGAADTTHVVEWP